MLPFFYSQSNNLSRAIASEDWMLARTLVTQHPNQASRWTERYGFFDGETSAKVLPLHEALVGHAPLECDQLIVQTYPAAVRERETSYERLPLHCACRSDPEPGIIRFLVSCCRKACLIPDRLGRLPLHYALTNGADPEVIKILMEANPSAAKGQDIYGWTPVAVACNVGASEEVVRMLLEASPDSVFIGTPPGGCLSSVIPINCPHRSALMSLIQRTKEKLESTAHLPSLRMKSFSSNMILT